jgi:F0F1-type ATP synthase membrane subunit a
VSFVSVGLFWASYEISGYWFDLARVDSFFIFQALLACYLLLYCRKNWTTLLAGIVFFTAFLTKQTTLVFYPLLLYGASKKGRGHFYTFLVSTFLLCTAFIFLYNRHTDGWFWFYTFKLPSQHHMEGRVFVRYLTKDLLGNFACSLSVVVLGIFFGLDSKGKEYLRSILRSRWFLIFLGGFLTSYLGRLKSGGWDNNLIYISATVPLLFGVVLKELLSDKTTALPLARLALVLTLCQFVSLSYNPRYTLPTSQDYRAGQILLERIREIPGEVYIPFHSYYARIAKGRMQVHGGALKDLAGVYSGGWQVDRLPPDLVEAIREKRYSAIFLDKEVESVEADSFARFVGQYYYRDRPLFRSGEPALRFFTGGKESPKFVYLPKGEYQDR